MDIQGHNEPTIGDMVNEIVDYLIAKDIAYIEAMRVVDECNAYLRMKRRVGRATCLKLADVIER